MKRRLPRLKVIPTRLGRFETEAEQQRRAMSFILRPNTRLKAANAARREGVRLVWKLIRCNKAGCRRCPHGPYLYARVRLPDGTRKWVYLGR